MTIQNEYDMYEPETFDELSIVCPYCKSDYDVGINEDYETNEDENESELECRACENEFLVVTCAFPRFSTYKRVEEVNQ